MLLLHSTKVHQHGNIDTDEPGSGEEVNGAGIALVQCQLGAEVGESGRSALQTSGIGDTEETIWYLQHISTYIQ